MKQVTGHESQYWDEAGGPTSREHGRSSTALRLVVLLLPLTVFLAGLRYMGSGDTEPAEFLPISLLTEKDLDFNEFVNSPDLPYPYRRVGDRVVSAYPVLPGLLNVPVHAAAKILGIDLVEHRPVLALITAALIASLSTLLLFSVLRRLGHSPRRALFFSLIYAFATCVWSVGSRGLWQHGPGLLFLTGAFDCLLSGSPAWAGLLLALAVAARPTNIVFALPLVLYVWRHRRRSLPLFIVLAGAVALLVAVYSAAYLGKPLAFGQAYRGMGFSGNVVTGLAGLLVSPSRGLFVFTPILLFSLAGGFLAWRREREPLYRHLTVGALFHLALYASWPMWWGGVSFGYRLLLELIPVLILLLAVAWKHVIVKRPALRAAFGVVLVFSLYVQYLGSYRYPSEFNQNIDLETARLWDVRDSELVLLNRKLWGGRSASQPARKPLYVWWRPELNDDSIPGWLDSSPGGSTVHGTLELSGWARSASGDVDVRLILDDRLVIAPERFPRPDVAAVLPELGDISHTGFRARIEPAGAETATHSLVVEFRDPAGKVRLLGPIRFRWRSS